MEPPLAADQLKDEIEIHPFRPRPEVARQAEPAVGIESRLPHSLYLEHGDWTYVCLPFPQGPEDVSQVCGAVGVLKA